MWAGKGQNSPHLAAVNGGIFWRKIQIFCSCPPFREEGDCSTWQQMMSLLLLRSPAWWLRHRCAPAQVSLQTAQQQLHTCKEHGYLSFREGQAQSAQEGSVVCLNNLIYYEARNDKFVTQYELYSYCNIFKYLLTSMNLWVCLIIEHSHFNCH